VQLRGDFGILREQIERPGKRERGGFVACEKQRDAFVAQLAIGHAAAIFIAGVEQHGQEVNVIFAELGAAAGD
jgi:hypothetical protein